jgi:hypothetical protein
MLAGAVPALAQGGPLGNLRAQYQEARVYEEWSRVWSVSGTPMTAGQTPREAAEGWVGEHGAVFGGPWLELDEFREARLRTAPEGKERRVFMYRQEMDGLPVVGSSFRVMTLGEPDSGPARVVYAAGRVAIRPEGGLPEPTVTQAQALGAAKAHPRGQELAHWSDPEPVAIYDDAPNGDAVAYPAWRIGGARETFAESYTFYIHAVAGHVARHYSNSLHATDGAHGTVTGNATPADSDIPHGLGPHTFDLTEEDCPNDPEEFILPDARVAGYEDDPPTLLVYETLTDETGAYELDVSSSTTMFVFAELVGPGWFILDGSDTNAPNYPWGDPIDPLPYSNNPVTTPATGVDLKFNHPTTSEKWTAFVNAHKEMSRIWRWLDLEASQVPDAPMVTHSAFSTCNAAFRVPASWNPWPQGNLILHQGKESECANSAYSQFIAHEYGHFTHWHLMGMTTVTSLQKPFLEGFSDTLGLLVYDAEIWNVNFWGCDGHSRWPRQGAPQYRHMYPMCNDQHTTCSMGKAFGEYCRGELLAALWLDIRDELGAEQTREYFLDWIMLAQIPPEGCCGDPCESVSQSAGPTTLEELMQVVPEEATAHRAAICFVFGQRQIQHPPPTPNPCQESAGWPCYADCDSSGVLDFWDFLCFQNAYLAANPYADCDGDGQLTFFDFLCFQSRFIAACP